MLKEQLEHNVMRVEFIKKDGTLRVMTCTLMEEFLPEVSGNSTSPAGITVVYDLESQGWRSFRDDSVIQYEKIEPRNA